MIAIEQQLVKKVKKKKGTIQYETMKIVIVVIVIIIVTIIVAVQLLLLLPIIRQGACMLNAVKNRIKMQHLNMKIRNKGH